MSMFYVMKNNKSIFRYNAYPKFLDAEDNFIRDRTYSQHLSHKDSGEHHLNHQEGSHHLNHSGGGGHHHHYDASNMKTKNLLIAVAVNLILTISQIIVGIISGSVALIADALHNFSDASSLFIALIARKISLKKPDYLKTFGYRRAEVIGAGINSIALIILGLYLFYEAVFHILNPKPILGDLVFYLALLGIIVNGITAYYTFKSMHSKNDINIRVAVLHNILDMLASVAVAISGIFIFFFKWYWIDGILTLLISSYIVYQGFSICKQLIDLLMNSVPNNIDILELRTQIEQIVNVSDVHHLHVWGIDVNTISLEAHVRLEKYDIQQLEQTKIKIKKLLKDKFKIEHSTLEFEFKDCICASPNCL